MGLVAHIRRDERHDFVSPGYARLVGTPPDRLRASTLREALGPDAYARIRRHVEAAFEGRHARYETCLGRGSARGAYRVDHLPVLRGGRTDGFFLVALPVPSRRAEQRSGRLQELRHEVRNALHNIATHAQLLQGAATRRQGVAARPSSALLVLREARRIGSLVDELAFATERVVDCEPVDLRELLETVAALRQPIAERRGVDVELALCEPGTFVDGDRDALIQALLNLINNAIEAMDGSGGRVVIGAEQHECGVRLSVADTGPGIPPGLDVFRAQVTTNASGHGLGLDVARRIAREHGGELSFEPNPGGGATFVLDLPSTRPHLRAAR